MIKSVLKILIINSLLLLLCGGLYAQELNPCATVMSDKQMNWLRDFQANPPADFKVGGEETYYIPIQMHIVGEDDGDGYFSRSSVLRMMCDVNTDFAATNAGMQFFLYNNEFIYHNDSDIYEHPSSGGAAGNFFSNNNTEEAVDVYIVSDPIGACGYFSPSRDYISVAKSCSQTGATTLTHELGHLFSLPHTFLRWEGLEVGEGQSPNDVFIERVARTGPTANCDFAGDGFCDTGADYVSARWSCPYTELTDPEGVTFTPDSSFYMSYATDGCHSRFSNQQIAAMQGNLLLIRDILLDHNQTLNFDDIWETQIHYPVPGADVPTGDVLLQWEPIEGASFYQIRVTNYALDYDYEDFIEGNSLVLEDVESDGLYVWSVKPFNDGNYCLPSVTGNFRGSISTSLLPEVLEVVPPTCTESADGSIYLEVKGGNGPYVYTWEDGTEGQTRENLPEGTYEVTIYDSGSDLSETIEIEIEEPSIISGEISQTINGAMAIDVEGGVPPYTVTWPNDSVGYETNDLNAGTNTLYIEDALGCNVEIEFEVLSVDFQVYSPSCIEDTDGQWEVINVNGGIPPYTYFYEGQSLETPVVGDLEAGIYQVEIRDSLGNSGFFDVEIVLPEEMSVNITNNGLSLSSSVTGGSPPYLIQWELTDEIRYGTNLDLEGVPEGIYAGTATDGQNCTETFSFVVEEPNGLSEIDNGSINLFPNPVSGTNQFYLALNLIEASKANLKVYNNIGKEVFAENKNLPLGESQWAVKTGKWASGLYFVSLEMEDGSSIIQKLIIE